MSNLKRGVFLLILCCFVHSPQVNAQNKINPYIKIMGAVGLYNIYQSYGITTADATIAAGLDFNDFFSVPIGVNNIKVINSQLDIVTLSISPTYRILKSKHAVSPVLSLDIGTQIWSNGNGRFVKPGNDYSFTSYKPESVGAYGVDQVRYKRGLLFYKTKLLVDFKINEFNLMFGPTFNLMYIKNENAKIDWSNGDIYFDEYISDHRGFGFELSLMYTFPMKKQSLDELENRD